MTNPTIFSRSEHQVSRSQISEHALKVLYRLHNAGFRACLVGGGVRDILLGLEPKDFDITTDASPEQVRNLFRNCRLIGRRFRLAHIHFGREIIEVATFRGEHKDEHAEHGVQDEESGRILRDNVYGTLEEDVWRRDFSVNALYYDIANFSIIDYVGAMHDLQARKLKLIGDPAARYREDPVRMLRAVRFAAKLDFEIEPDSAEPITQLADLLSTIPAARLVDECIKLFHSGNAVKCFQLLRDFGLFVHLFPQTEAALQLDPEYEVFLVKVLQSTDQRIIEGKPVNPAFVFAALLWKPVMDRAIASEEQGMPRNMALQDAITDVLPSQNRITSIPKRLTLVMKDIWFLQPRFANRTGKRAFSVLGHARFRAAYDFLCLRAAAGEDVAGLCEYWTQIQELSETERKRALTAKNRPRKRKPHSPSRQN